MSHNDYKELTVVMGRLKERGDLPGTMLDAVALAFKEIGMQEMADKIFAVAEAVWEDHVIKNGEA